MASCTEDAKKPTYPSSPKASEHADSHDLRLPVSPDKTLCSSSVPKIGMLEVCGSFQSRLLRCWPLLRLVDATSSLVGSFSTLGSPWLSYSLSRTPSFSCSFLASRLSSEGIKKLKKLQRAWGPGCPSHSRKTSTSKIAGSRMLVCCTGTTTASNLQTLKP